MRGGAAARLRQRLAPRRLLDAARRTVSCALASRVALLVPLLLCTRLSSVVLKRRAQPWDDLSSDDRRDLIEALRERVTPPPPYRIGGEVLEAEAYQRFLQVQDWSVPKAAEMLTKDLEWRSRIRPREIHPRNIPTACSQRGWLVLMRHHGSNTLVDVDENPAAPPVNHTSHHHRAPFSRWHLPGAHSFHFPHPHFHLPHAFHRHGHNRPSLHPPHVKPAFAHWVYTRHGMPVTYINVKAWHPELFKSKDECTRFCAYHMEHYIRRMPIRRGRRVQRCAILISLTGFKASMVPYVCECIQILRRHYPGRLGVACLYNTPPYWYPFWRIFCGLFDEEIMSKVHFLPANIHDVEGALAWCNKQSLAPYSDLRLKV